MRSLLAWLCLVVVFDGVTCTALRAVVKPAPAVAGEMTPGPRPDCVYLADLAQQEQEHQCPPPSSPCPQLDSVLHADQPLCTPVPVHNVLGVPADPPTACEQILAARLYVQDPHQLSAAQKTACATPADQR